MLQCPFPVVDLEIPTKSVWSVVNPLAVQVGMMSGYCNKKKGTKHKKLLNCARNVNKVSFSITEVARGISQEHPEIRAELEEACNRTLEVYKLLKRKLDSDTKEGGAILDLSKQVVNNVTRILLVIDSADLILLERLVKQVLGSLDQLERCGDMGRLGANFEQLAHHMDALLRQISARVKELLLTERKEDLALVRAMWNRCRDRLLSSCRVAIAHPDVEPALKNRQEVLEEARESLRRLQTVLRNKGGAEPLSKAGTLASCLQQLELGVVFATEMTKERLLNLRQLFSVIQTEARSIAESACTRPERQEQISRLLKECETALCLLRIQDEQGNELVIDKICGLTSELSHYLQLATLDHIDDFYFLPHIPFQVLYRITSEGAHNTSQHKESEKEMAQHVLNLEMITKMACSLSADPLKNKMVRTAIANIVSLFKQVVFATRSLAVQSKSEYTRHNIEVYRKCWTHQLGVLVAAVDELCPVEEYLFVSAGHVREDLDQVQMILETETAHVRGEEHSWADLDQAVDALANRALRVLSVVEEDRVRCVAQRNLPLDAVIRHIHTMKRGTLAEMKSLCSEVVHKGKPKYTELLASAQAALAKLEQLRILYFKSKARVDAYVESFRGELHYVEHLLGKAPVTSVTTTCSTILSLLSHIVLVIESETVTADWPHVVSRARELVQMASQLEQLLRDTQAARAGADISETVQTIVQESDLPDLVGRFAPLGDVFVSVLIAAEGIVKLVPGVLADFRTVMTSGKRKKMFRK